MCSDEHGADAGGHPSDLRAPTYDTGTKIGLEMPPERTYFFDADTGDVRTSRERITL